MTEKPNHNKNYINGEPAPICPLRGEVCYAIWKQETQFCPLSMLTRSNHKDLVMCAIKRIGVAISRIEYNQKLNAFKKTAKKPDSPTLF